MTMFQSQTIEKPISYAENPKIAFVLKFPRHESSAQKPDKGQISLSSFARTTSHLTSNSESCEQTTQVSPFSNFLIAISKVFSATWTKLRSLFYPAKQGKTPAGVNPVFHQHYSGFFYNKTKSQRIGKGPYSVRDDAFHFYDEPLTKVMKWALLALGLDDIFAVKDLDSSTQGGSIRITNEENKEWMISIPDFLTISDLSNLRRFLNNKEGFNDYHASSRLVGEIRK